jgi:hypothetical protein
MIRCGPAVHTVICKVEERRGGLRQKYKGSMSFSAFSTGAKLLLPLNNKHYSQATEIHTLDMNLLYVQKVTKGYNIIIFNKN